MEHLTGDARQGKPGARAKGAELCSWPQRIATSTQPQQLHALLHTRARMSTPPAHRAGGLHQAQSSRAARCRRSARSAAQSCSPSWWRCLGAGVTRCRGGSGKSACSGWNSATAEAVRALTAASRPHFHRQCTPHHHHHNPPAAVLQDTLGLLVAGVALAHDEGIDGVSFTVTRPDDGHVSPRAIADPALVEGEGERRIRGGRGWSTAATERRFSSQPAVIEAKALKPAAAALHPAASSEAPPCHQRLPPLLRPPCGR